MALGQVEQLRPLLAFADFLADPKSFEKSLAGLREMPCNGGKKQQPILLQP